MLHHQLFSVGMSALVQTPSSPEAPVTSLPPLAWGLLVLLFVLFIPAFVWSSYSVRHVYTTLAIVENPTPAAYEAVSSDDHDATPASAPGTGYTDDADASTVVGDEAGASAASGPPTPITSSILRIRRTLRSTHGWVGDFRGLRLALLIAVLSGIGSSVIEAVPFIFPFVGSLIMSLVLVQFSTAWVHAVIRTTSSRDQPEGRSVFHGGLPQFRRTFEATSIPVLLSWLAQAVTGFVTLVVASALGLQTYDIRNPADVPVYSHHMLWKLLVVGIVAIVLGFVLVIPANVLLVRVQASMLPPNEDTVVPFDKSFSGTVEPAVMGGRGYVTLKDAFRTFSAASWRRVMVLYVKANLVSIGVNLLFAAIVIPIVALTARTN